MSEADTMRRASQTTRRGFLRGTAGVGVAATVAATPAATGRASASEGADLDAWFEKTTNYDGVVDETGKDEVTISVGSDANGGAFGFGPAAVRVDPGTTVVWEWTGEGGSHNVVAADGSFESEMTGEKGHTFEQTVESEGVVKYACQPHDPMGMRGALVVGDAAVGAGASGDGMTLTPETTAVGGSILLSLLSPLVFGAFLYGRSRGKRETTHSPGMVEGASKR